MRIIAKLARLKRKILQTPLLKDKRLPPYWFDRFLGDAPSFVCQIGSNDGKTGDPLFSLLNKNKKWKALFVEPVPYLFKKLKENYSDTERFIFENVAINEGDKVNFYWIDPVAKDKLKDLPSWFDQLGSFNRQHILNHLDGELEPYIKSEELECLTLSRLFEKNNISQIDILHIDTEGHDWKILSQLNLDVYSPQFILFEKRHLSQEDLNLANDFLKIKYKLFDVGMDLLAINKNFSGKNMIEISKQMKPFKSNT